MFGIRGTITTRLIFLLSFFFTRNTSTATILFISTCDSELVFRLQRREGFFFLLESEYG